VRAPEDARVVFDYLSRTVALTSSVADTSKAADDVTKAELYDREVPSIGVVAVRPSPIARGGNAFLIVSRSSTTASRATYPDATGSEFIAKS
jgi:hypothetical protein